MPQSVPTVGGRFSCRASIRDGRDGVLRAVRCPKRPSPSTRTVTAGVQRESLPQGRFWLAESAFALLLTRVTEPKLLYYKEDYEENYQRDGGQRLGEP